MRRSGKADRPANPQCGQCRCPARCRSDVRNLTASLDAPKDPGRESQTKTDEQRRSGSPPGRSVGWRRQPSSTSDPEFIGWVAQRGDDSGSQLFRPKIYPARRTSGRDKAGKDQQGQTNKASRHTRQVLPTPGPASARRFSGH